MQNSSGAIPHQPYQNIKLDECHICLEPLIGELAEVSCGHIYHYDCLVGWITKKGAHKACCICAKNTEIVNIITFPPTVNTLNSTATENINNQINTVTYPSLPEPQENDFILPEDRIKKYKCCQIL